MEAWQNLIRVLTHEIMNSVTPIVSLSSTASSLLGTAMGDGRAESGYRRPETADGRDNPADPHSASGPQFDERNTEILGDVKSALDTISKRSGGLLHFVDDYRNLTRIPVPNFQLIKVAELFARIRKLFGDRFDAKGIRCTCFVEPFNLELTGDPDLIEQVIINLVMNSMSALSSIESPAIKLVGKLDGRGGTIVQIIDNGHGVPEALLEKIFIPFFTTRKEGSGIGLSLSRQIMRAHKGGLTVQSDPQKETTFTLRF